MNTRRWTDVTASLCWAVVLLELSIACKDDDACDPGQEERGPNACYPSSAGSAATPGGAGAAGEGAAGEGTSDSGAPAPSGDEFGQPCTDIAGSSDCGGSAPRCIPFPAGSVCTQVLCLDGEPNAGACPAEWPCSAPPGFPSACSSL